MVEGWDWELTNRAKRDFASLDDTEQSRIAQKLDDIVQDEWREPGDYLEPLEGLGIGSFASGSFGSGVVQSFRPGRSTCSGFRNVVPTPIAAMIELEAGLFRVRIHGGRG